MTGVVRPNYGTRIVTSLHHYQLQGANKRQEHLQACNDMQ
jgi:hypothetical protein